MNDLLLGVWRAACRNIELDRAVQEIAAIVAERVPASLAVVRRVDIQRSCVETVATGATEGGPVRETGRTVLRERDLESLLSWCRTGSVLHVGAGRPDAAMPAKGSDGRPRFVPVELEGDVLAGPLAPPPGPAGAPSAMGVLLLAARAGARFAPEHVAICQELLEPFAAAMANDARLRELKSLQEAAEADRRTLLTRLGRQAIADTIVGAEGGLRELMERITLVAPSDVPVLLIGETGSGKELAARALHERSRRAGKPFHRVNCGAIPPELIDSELFGHERGSFTGAEATRRGWFERADGGTLFLDEVGELPPAAQVRLLRVLQDGVFERVGGQRSLHADVRIVAATHRDLQAMIAEGRFREDLWYRIAVFPIRIPPLRERPGDIPALATHFALKAANRFGTTPLAPTPADLSLLVSYPWPGNVRELASVIERAVILGNGRTLEVRTALGVAPPQQPGAAGAAGAVAVPPASGVPGAAGVELPAAPMPPQATMPLDAAMARHIEAVLRQRHGRIEGPFGAAAALGLKPHALRARMRKLGIDWRSFRRPRSA